MVTSWSSKGIPLATKIVKVLGGLLITVLMLGNISDESFSNYTLIISILSVLAPISKMGNNELAVLNSANYSSIRKNYSIEFTGNLFTVFLMIIWIIILGKNHWEIVLLCSVNRIALSSLALEYCFESIGQLWRTEKWKLLIYVGIYPFRVLSILIFNSIEFFIITQIIENMLFYFVVNRALHYRWIFPRITFSLNKDNYILMISAFASVYIQKLPLLLLHDRIPKELYANVGYGYRFLNALNFVPSLLSRVRYSEELVSSTMKSKSKEGLLVLLMSFTIFILIKTTHIYIDSRFFITLNIVSILVFKLPFDYLTSYYGKKITEIGKSYYRLIMYIVMLLFVALTIQIMDLINLQHLFLLLILTQITLTSVSYIIVNRLQ